MLEASLPTGYELVLGADVLELRRCDGSVVAAFGTHGFTEKAVEEAAREDLWAWTAGGARWSATLRPIHPSA